MSLKKNQKQLLSFLTLFVFSVPLFLFWDPLFASAATPGWVKDLGATITSGMGNAVAYPFKLLLYAIFVVEGWFANVAFTLFNWAINPKYITIFFNLASIYEMWKFVRDFFNLFFILVLLFTAFSIIFQIDKYSNKKIILQLVIAALFVNFSFPISRMIIDATNVPMYFFAQQMSGPDGNGVFGQTLSASRIQNILIPNGDFVQAEFSRLILAIVFMFLFSMTLLVLAVLFLIRLIALLVLVVFSSAGFVASLVPGMQKFSSDWWSNFMKYALFGPAAMFMLLLATRFFAEIDGTDIGLQQVASGASINGLQEMIGSMALFSIPIVMLWMAMGVSNSFSIAGSKTVVGWGKNTSIWARRQAANVGKAPFRPIATRAQAAGQGLKKGVNQGKLFGWNYSNLKTPGLKVGGVGVIPAVAVGKAFTGQAYKERKEEVQAKYSGFVSGGKKGVETELDKLHNKKVYEKMKENKDNNVNRSILIKDLESKDKAERQAAALSLAESGDIRTDEVFQKAVKAVGKEVTQDLASGKITAVASFDNDKLLRILEKSKDDAIGDMSAETYKMIASHGDLYQKDKDPKTGRETFRLDKDGKRIPEDGLDILNGKLKKEGNIKVRVDYEIDEKVSAGMSVAEAQKEVFESTIGKLSSDDLAKQGSIHSAIGKPTEPNNDALKSYLKEKSVNDTAYFQEAMKKMSQVNRQKWYDADIVPKTEGTGGDPKQKREAFQERARQGRERNQRPQN